MDYSLKELRGNEEEGDRTVVQYDALVTRLEHRSDIGDLEGKQPEDKEWLKSLHREGDMENHVFLNMCEEMPSGPVEVLDLREQRRLSISSSVHWMSDRV